MDCVNNDDQTRGLIDIAASNTQRLHYPSLFIRVELRTSGVILPTIKMHFIGSHFGIKLLFHHFLYLIFIIVAEDVPGGLLAASQQVLLSILWGYIAHKSN